MPGMIPVPIGASPDAPAPSPPDVPAKAPIPGGELTLNQLMKASLTDFPGQTEPGNIDLTNRPRVKNKDGSTSTIRSLGVNVDGQEVLIPTVSEDGRIMSDDEAVEQYKLTGRHLGKFDSVEASNNAAERLHEQQADTLAAAPSGSAPPPGSSAEAARRNAEERRAIGDEAVANATERAALEKDKADKAEAFRAESAARLAKLQGEQELHRQVAAAHVADLRGKAESEPYHKFWETRSTGQEILTAIGIILGGVSWNANHVNRGVEILNNAMSRDLQLQKDKHADLWHRVDEAQQGVRDLDASDLHDLAAFQAGEGAKWDAVSGRLNAMIAANRGKGDITSAKSAAADANEKATLAWQNAEHATALASHYRATEAAEKERADAAMYKAQHGKGARGTGGGGGGRAAFVADFADAAGKLPKNTPIPRELTLLGIKAGLKPKDIPDQVKKYQTEGGQGGSSLQISSKDRPFRDESGKVLGTIPQRNAVKFAHDDALLTQASERLNSLANDIQKQHTVTSPDDIQRRAALYANAIIAVATTSPLGKTNEAIHQEAASIGLSGAIDPDHLVDSIKGILTKGGANLEAVRHKAKESIEQRDRFRKQTLEPLTAAQEQEFNSKKGGDSQGNWIAIPARLSDKPQAKGKTEMLVSDDGKFLGSFR